MRFGSRRSVLLFLGILIAVSPASAYAQGTDKAPPKRETTSRETPAASPTSQAQPALPPMPDTTQLTLFIQIAMSALAQANMTGNYTVLHALGAPSFQTANPPAKLSETFARTRASVDLVPIILYQPILTTPPAISAQGLLRLTGYYDTQPLNVMFDLLFVPVAGQWRMEGIAVQTRPAAAAAPPAQAASSQPPAPSAQSAPTKAAAPAKK